MTGTVYRKNTETHKFCPRCHVMKPRTEFYKDRSTSDGFNARCKSCHHERSAAWRRSEYQDLQVGIYETLLEKQNGVCALCLRKDNGRWGDRRLSIDHNHQTGKIRGLI